MEKGTVVFIGAGPGDPGLLTIKGKTLLAAADAIVYDALVGKGLRALFPADAALYDVGKRAGHHAMPQEEINALLVRLAKEGKRVVRLKGGDPFLFGRGGEELAALKNAGFPAKIVPGVTSAMAVPAYFGIPATHRDMAASVHIITGHRKEKMPLSLDFDALARLSGTLIFLMGVSALGEICQGLLQAGMDEETPAALLIQGTTARQRRIAATLATLEQEVAKDTGSKTPAILIIGEVCSLAETLSWQDVLPLSGRRILLTRPRAQSEGVAERLRLLGAEVWELPLLRLVSRRENEKFLAALEELGITNWLVFTSSIGVRVFFEQLKEKRVDLRQLAALRIAVMGKGTAQELEKNGLYADVMPAVFDSAHLGAAIAAAAKKGEHVLLPRSAAGAKELVETLEGAGLFVNDVATYDPLPIKATDAEPYREALLQGDVDAVVFTSAMGVRTFAQTFAELAFENVRALCIGERTAEEARRWGMATATAGEASEDGLVTLVQHCFDNREDEK